MKKAYRLSELGKLNKIESILFVSIFLWGFFIIISLLFYNFFSWLTLIPALCVTIYLIVKANKKLEYPLGYILLLYLLSLSFLLLILASLKFPVILVSSFIMITILVYIGILGFFVYYGINVVYFFGLKKMFPFEKMNEQKGKTKLPGRKNLSRYLTLNKQMIYYNINLVNISLYLLFVVFGFMFFIKYVSGSHVEVLSIFNSWVKRQEWVNFSNGISVFSILIAIYTITFPVQNKIMEEAENNYRNRYKEYI